VFSFSCKASHDNETMHHAESGQQHLTHQVSILTFFLLGGGGWSLYFRTPKSLIVGLMWIVMKDNRYHLRHVCKHEDNLSTYGWTKHNGRDFGHQVLVNHGMTMTSGFLKSKVEGNGYGGDWTVRINVQIDK